MRSRGGRGSRIGRQYRVPAWHGQGGPGAAVEREAARQDAAKGPGSAGWRLLAGHLKTVWGAQREASGQTPVRGKDIEFAVRVARHVVGCRACSGDAGLALWAIAYPRLAVEDVVRPLR